MDELIKLLKKYYKCIIVYNNDIFVNKKVKGIEMYNNFRFDDFDDKIHLNCKSKLSKNDRVIEEKDYSSIFLKNNLLTKNLKNFIKGLNNGRFKKI